MKEYFESLEKLLKIEQEEDEKQYAENLKKSDLSTRREEGWTWYPLAIRGQELQRTDYLVVELERTTHTYFSHNFRSGSPVNFFSNRNPKEDRISGIVTFVSGSKMKVQIKQDELPDWASNGKLGVDLAFDNVSYAEMFNAIKAAKSHEFPTKLFKNNPVASVLF